MSTLARGILNVLGLETRSSAVTSTLSGPASWLVNWMGGITEPTNGLAVTDAMALSIATVWACGRVISEDVAKLPIMVVQTLPDGTKKRHPDHPVSVLLNRRPNPEMNAMGCRETLISNAVWRGNGVAEIERTNKGEPKNIWPLEISRLQLRRTVNAERGPLEYVYQGLDRPVTLAPENVLHIKGLGNGLWGKSVLRAARETLGLAYSARKFGSGFFSKGGRPTGVLKHPKALSAEAQGKIASSIKSQMGSLNDTGGMLLIHEGMEFQAMGISPEEAQFLGTQQASVEEICSWFRVQPHKVMHLLRSTFSNIEHQSIEYVTDSLGGWMARFESEADLKLFTPQEIAAGFGIEHDDHELTRGDALSRSQAYRESINAGWMNRDEVRERESLNPIPNGLGQIFTVPSTMDKIENIRDRKPGKAPNMVNGGANGGDPANPDTNPDANPDASGDAASQDGSGAQPADKPKAAGKRGNISVDSIAKAMIPALEGALRSSVTIECDRLTRALGQGKSALDWTREFYPDHEVHVRGSLIPIVESAIYMLAASAPGANLPSAQRCAKRMAQQLTSNHYAQLSADKADAAAIAATWRESRAESDAIQAAELLAELLAGNP